MVKEKLTNFFIRNFLKNYKKNNCNLLYNTDNFEYDIYFNKHDAKDVNIFFDMYLIPKDEKFSKDIVNKFVELGDFAYFDFEKIRENR